MASSYKYNSGFQPTPDYLNYYQQISGQSDPTRLQSAYQSLMGQQGYQWGNPGARPGGWFIAAGKDASLKQPTQKY